MKKQLRKCKEPWRKQLATRNVLKLDELVRGMAIAQSTDGVKVQTKPEQLKVWQNRIEVARSPPYTGEPRLDLKKDEHGIPAWAKHSVGSKRQRNYPPFTKQESRVITEDRLRELFQ